jgi:hypothetical protein
MFLMSNALLHSICVSSYLYICVLIPLYVSACRYIGGDVSDVQLSVTLSSVTPMCPHISNLYMCPHTSIYVSSYLYICVRMPLYMCPHTSTYVSSYLEPLHVSSYLYSVLIPLYIPVDMCPHTSIYVSSYLYICVLILLYMCPHTSIYVSSYLYICVLIPLHMCPHTSTYVSSYLEPLHVSSYLYSVLIPLYIPLYMCPHTPI